MAKRGRGSGANRRQVTVQPTDKSLTAEESRLSKRLKSPWSVAFLALLALLLTCAFSGADTPADKFTSWVRNSSGQGFPMSDMCRTVSQSFDGSSPGRAEVVGNLAKCSGPRYNWVNYLRDFFASLILPLFQLFMGLLLTSRGLGNGRVRAWLPPTATLLLSIIALIIFGNTQMDLESARSVFGNDWIVAESTSGSDRTHTVLFSAAIGGIAASGFEFFSRLLTTKDAPGESHSARIPEPRKLRGRGKQGRSH